MSEGDEPDDSTTVEDVTSSVLRRVTPDADEREALAAVASTLVERAESAARELCAEADVVRVGSTARNTWISGDRDIDIFVRFPPHLDRESLERYGLQVGHETLPAGEEEYAEHPYVTGQVDGFDIDVVPCYRLDDATDVRTSVDRTPFHTEYLLERLTPELEDEIRVTKQFMKGIGVYGSDLKTRGFGGYLIELLVLHHGGFTSFLEAATEWSPPVEIDPAEHAQASFDDPLVVIDPTDPERNVAAVVIAGQLARFQHYARQMVADPSLRYFDPSPPSPIDSQTLSSHLERRDTTSIAIRFTPPDVVDDQLYPQLRKSATGITVALESRDFDVLRSTIMVDATAVLLFELAVAELPGIERHVGPPVGLRNHAEGFFESYADDQTVYGPFIEDDRYVIERPRQWRRAVEFLESEELFEVGLGTHVATALEGGYDLLVDEEIESLLPTFADDLGRYFDPTLRV